MKQAITTQQLSELSPKGQERYYSHTLNMTIKDAHRFMSEIKRHEVIEGTYLMNIGQLIEFLENNTQYKTTIWRRTIDWKVRYGEVNYEYTKRLELCDALWEAVKEVIESE